jgi:hypothetical protein
MSIDTKGTVYAEWVSTTIAGSGTTTFPTTPTAHYISRSTDHGGTWTHSRITPLSYATYEFVAGGMVWTPDGGPDGTLHLVYDANPKPTVKSYGEVFYVQSKDSGKTWSKARSLTGGGANSTDLLGQFYGTLSVAPNGRLDVAWWDQRNDPGTQGYNVYYSSSPDSGITWSQNTRVTAQTISRRFGIWGNGFDMTSPPAIASTNDYAMLAWDDTTHNDPTTADSISPGGGLQDIMTAAVQYRPLEVGGSAHNGARVVLAVIVGVQAVGLILIIMSFRRRRDGPRGNIS